MTGKGFLRVIACSDHRPIHSFDGDTGRLEDRSLVLAGELHGEALLLWLNLHDDVFEGITLALDEPNRSGDRRGTLYGLHLVPPFKTTMGTHGQFQKVSHPTPHIMRFVFSAKPRLRAQPSRSQFRAFLIMARTPIRGPLESELL